MYLTQRILHFGHLAEVRLLTNPDYSFTCLQLDKAQRKQSNPCL